MSDKLAAQVVPGRGVVGLHGGGEAGGRPRGATRSHVFVHLSGTSVPILVVPEVDVVLTVHRLHAEPAADLHGKEMMLPLLKGNIRVGESVPTLAVRHSQFGFKSPHRHAPSMVACPTCARAMEAGFLGAQNWPSGIQWFRSKNFFGLHGEPIGESDRTQMSWLAASRCSNCPILHASY